MVLIDPIIEIGLISLIVVALSKLLQSKMIDKKKQKAAQARMKEKQAKIKELMKSQDEKGKREMERLQKEMFEDMNETMKGSMRYMMFSLPLFFGAFFILGTLYGGMLLKAPFPLPKFEGFFFLNPFSWVPVGWGPETGWLKWYFIIYLIASIILGIAMKIVEKVRKAKETGPEAGKANESAPEAEKEKETGEEAGQ